VHWSGCRYPLTRPELVAVGNAECNFWSARPIIPTTGTNEPPCAARWVVPTCQRAQRNASLCGSCIRTCRPSDVTTHGGGVCCGQCRLSTEVHDFSHHLITIDRVGCNSRGCASSRCALTYASACDTRVRPIAYTRGTQKEA
jgi:hypothetical protein